MPVFILSKVAGQTKQGYDSVLKFVEGPIKEAPGFIMHSATPQADCWVITEVWESKKQADDWFAKFVVPNLPAGIHPKRTYYDLYSLVLPNSTTISNEVFA